MLYIWWILCNVYIATQSVYTNLTYTTPNPQHQFTTPIHNTNPRYYAPHPTHTNQFDTNTTNPIQPMIPKNLKILLSLFKNNNIESHISTMLYEKSINKEKISTDSNMDRQLPWIEKYRPKDLNRIISHTDIILSLRKFIDKKSLPHLLFFGPSGSGKTSTIKCCANEIYGQYASCMTLELNASNERGIETVRTKIKNFVTNRNSIFLPKEMGPMFKMVILDEIDSMTVEAQGMLRQTIEKNSSTTRFCLICNDIDKINPALQSRCARYCFSPLKSKDMQNRFDEICQLENILCDKNAIDAIIKLSKGDMRSGINMLQHINITTGKNKITSDSVYKVSGYCMPQIIAEIFGTLTSLSKKKITLIECTQSITDIVIENNITIFNMLEELKNSVIRSKYSIEQKIFLIDNFACNEIYDSVNVDHKNILMIIASLFVVVSKIK